MLLRCENVAHAHIRKRMYVVITVQECQKKECCACAHQKTKSFLFWEHFICFKYKVIYKLVKLVLFCVKHKWRAFLCLRRFFVIFSFFQLLLAWGYVIRVCFTFFLLVSLLEKIALPIVFLLGSPLEKFASPTVFRSGTAKEYFSFV